MLTQRRLFWLSTVVALYLFPVRYLALTLLAYGVWRWYPVIGSLYKVYRRGDLLRFGQMCRQAWNNQLPPQVERVWCCIWSFARLMLPGAVYEETYAKMVHDMVAKSSRQDPAGTRRLLHSALFVERFHGHKMPPWVSRVFLALVQENSDIAAVRLYYETCWSARSPQAQQRILGTAAGVAQNLQVCNCLRELGADDSRMFLAAHSRCASSKDLEFLAVQKLRGHTKLAELVSMNDLRAADVLIQQWQDALARWLVLPPLVNHALSYF